MVLNDLNLLKKESISDGLKEQEEDAEFLIIYGLYELEKY